MSSDRPDLLVKHQLNQILSKAKPPKKTSKRSNDGGEGTSKSESMMDYKAYRESMGLKTNILEAPAKKS